MSVPKRVKFVYNKPEDYKIYPANGVLGGVTARNDIVINFFVESPLIPDHIVQNLNADGRLVPTQVVPKEEIVITRDLQVGIILNLKQAESIADWIKDKIEKSKLVEKETEKNVEDT